MIRSLILVSMFSVGQASELPAQELKLDNVKARRSYAIGLNVGRNIRGDGLDLDLNILIRGVRDAMSNANPALDDSELSEIMEGIENEMVRRIQELAAKNLKDGREFLDKNKQKRGIVTLDSGLQYEVLKAGEGDSPKITDKVTTHYHGTLLDGTVFDSSVQRGKPATFAVGNVIRGWTEALQKMKVGDKWKLYIPSELAYGPRGAGGVIGPNSVLIFEVELLGISNE
ncbi:MAG: FKBP-type peptidyl-prolyl cis-trans isomerase [Planctomycetales bacterium]|nr:FKBP-type peptidyl-prolyl cis-trans isomerase [Planctomycetales bacterium]